MRVFAIIGAFVMGLALLGAAPPAAWWQPLRQLRAWQLNQQGQHAYRANEPAKAVAAFQKARAVAGDHPILRLNEGTALMALKQWQQAEGSLRAALKGLPSEQKREQAVGYYSLGNLYFAQSRWDEAAKAYIEALKRTPNDWDAKFNLELVLRRLQQPPSQRQRPQPPPPPPPPVHAPTPFMKQLQGRVHAP